ncbi:hypothetical protein B0H65DRAFT_60425 [Neurospora tetraspora]|uniref:Uncharacterized protein n=1 Tax=Neurospora tetraspora TaxID=94610 RepID=A0AAE0MXD6_9PEZI|nr:hypothetical protein B0H65DRAFT_60425 [Neurospora tetraspora]
MGSVADFHQSPSSTLGDTEKSSALEQTETKREDKNPPGSSWSIVFIARALIYRFLLFTFDCSDVQPLLALFFWPAHIFALGLLLLDVHYREAFMIRRLSTDSPKLIRGKLRTGAQLHLDPVFLLSLLCVYWVKLLESIVGSALAETRSANNLPIDNPTPSNEEKKEECLYTAEEIDLVLRARQLASKTGHSVVGICRWVENMNAKDPLWEQNWRTTRLPLCVSEDCGLQYYESIHNALNGPSEFDPLRQPTGLAQDDFGTVNKPSSEGSMAAQYPDDCGIDDLDDPDVSAPSGEDQKNSSNLESARNQNTNGFRPIPDNCDDYLYPAEGKHRGKQRGKHQGEQKEIPVTYIELTAEEPTPDTYGFTPLFPRGTCGPSTYSPNEALNGKPIDEFTSSKVARDSIELLLEAARKMPLPAPSTRDNSNAFMPLTPEKKTAPESSDGGGGGGDGARFKIAPSEGWERVTSALDPDVERTSSVVTTYGSSDGERASSVANGSDNGKDEKDEKDEKDKEDEKNVKDEKDEKDEKDGKDLMMGWYSADTPIKLD